MNQGKVVQVGTPWDIYYRPRNMFVADFVGIANFIRGKVTESTASGILIDTGEEVVRLAPRDSQASVGQKVVLSVRPETILLSKEPPEDQRNVLTGRIKTHSFVGHFIRYWVLCGTREFIVDLHDPSGLGVQEGQVFLQLPPSKLHLIPEGE